MVGRHRNPGHRSNVRGRPRKDGRPGRATARAERPSKGQTAKSAATGCGRSLQAEPRDVSQRGRHPRRQRPRTLPCEDQALRKGSRPHKGRALAPLPILGIRCGLHCKGLDHRACKDYFFTAFVQHVMIFHRHVTIKPSPIIAMPFYYFMSQKGGHSFTCPARLSIELYGGRIIWTADGHESV